MPAVIFIFSPSLYRFHTIRSTPCLIYCASSSCVSLHPMQKGIISAYQVQMPGIKTDVILIILRTLCHKMLPGSVPIPAQCIKRDNIVMYWSDTLADAMSYMASPWIIPLIATRLVFCPLNTLSPEGIVQTESDSVDYLPFAIGSADILFYKRTLDLFGLLLSKRPSTGVRYFSFPSNKENIPPVIHNHFHREIMCNAPPIYILQPILVCCIILCLRYVVTSVTSMFIISFYPTMPVKYSCQGNRLWQ